MQRLNFININATLNAAFSPSNPGGWASDPDIYAGLSGVFENIVDPTVVDGDQYRTLYVSSRRNSVGTVGSSGSTQWNLSGAGNLTLGATNMLSLNGNFALRLPNLSQGVVPVADSVIDNQNPTTLAGSQTTAFGQFSGGVQQRGSASSIGTFGDAGEVQFALDLQRLVPDSTVDAGEVAGVSRRGSFEGTVTVATNGDVSFTTQATGGNTPFDLWVASFPALVNSPNAADRSPTGDFDMDGRNNTNEFAFGGSPVSASDNGQEQLRTVDANADTLRDYTQTVEVRSGANFTASGNKLTATVDGITYTIEGSLDLVSFESPVSEVSPTLGTGLPKTGYVFKTFRLNAANGLTGKGVIRAGAAANAS
jgi:hypothetical protein